MPHETTEESESKARLAETPARISNTFSSPGRRIGRVCLRMIWWGGWWGGMKTW